MCIFVHQFIHGHFLEKFKPQESDYDVKNRKILDILYIFYSVDHLLDFMQLKNVLGVIIPLNYYSTTRGSPD